MIIIIEPNCTWTSEVIIISFNSTCKSEVKSVIEFNLTFASEVMIVIGFNSTFTSELLCNLIVPVHIFIIEFSIEFNSTCASEASIVIEYNAIVPVQVK